ncbi:MAG: DNA repair protein RadC [Clostridia bacterium]|nr:DNA repair protein RadC [Clostridia bacterium]
MTTKITELPKYERPYEKLEIYGEKELSNSELLAILIESGTKEESSIQLAQKVLALCKESLENELRFLQNISIEELKKIKGIGRVKAIRLKATFELAKRMSQPVAEDIFVYSSSDVAKIFMEELMYEKREIVKLIILNNKNKILRIQNISLGGTNYAVIEPKEVLAEPIKMNANKIILLHNHPSGNATPSNEDYEVSKRISLCAEMFGIEFIDHIVIGDGEYRSALVKNK